MVHLEAVHLGWSCLIASWEEKMVDEIPEEFLKPLCKNINEICSIMLPFVRKNCREMVGSVDANLINSVLNLISSFIGTEGGRLDLKKSQLPDLQNVVMNYLTFSLCWSLGANLHDSSRQTFSDKFRQEMKKRFLQYPDGDIYDYGIDPETHKLGRWEEKIPAFNYDPEKSFFEILVPTGDTTKYMFLLNTLISAGFNVLITGETGVGKSVVTKEFLVNAPDHIVSAIVNFSGKTTTKNLQDAFEGNL